MLFSNYIHLELRSGWVIWQGHRALSSTYAPRAKAPPSTLGTREPPVQEERRQPPWVKQEFDETVESQPRVQIKVENALEVRLTFYHGHWSSSK